MSGPWIAAFVALWIVVVVLGFLVVGTLRRLVPVIERSDARLLAEAAQSRSTGLTPGTIVPAFEAQEIGGNTLTDADLRGSTTIALFLGSSCEACDSFVGDLQAGRIPDLGARLVVIADDAELARGFSAVGVRVLLQEGYSLSRVFDSDRVPHAFIVGEDGRVLASGWPNDWGNLDSLVQEAEKGGVPESDLAEAVLAS